MHLRVLVLFAQSLRLSRLLQSLRLRQPIECQLIGFLCATHLTHFPAQNLSTKFRSSCNWVTATTIGRVKVCLQFALARTLAGITFMRWLFKTNKKLHKKLLFLSANNCSSVFVSVCVGLTCLHLCTCVGISRCCIAKQFSHSTNNLSQNKTCCWSHKTGPKPD